MTASFHCNSDASRHIWRAIVDAARNLPTRLIEIDQCSSNGRQRVQRKTVGRRLQLTLHPTSALVCRPTTARSVVRGGGGNGQLPQVLVDTVSSADFATGGPWLTAVSIYSCCTRCMYVCTVPANVVHPVQMIDCECSLACRAKP
jgi:hypothetical protein